MPNQPSIILQKERESKIATGLSKSFVDQLNALSFSGNNDSLALKKMDSTQFLSSETIDADQDHKRKCFEKLVVRRERMTPQIVEDVKCALEAQVVDDTALIEASFAIIGFKNRYKTETDAGYGNHRGNTFVLRNPKQEIDGKKKRNKGVKKQGERCSMKCLNQKKLNSQVVKDKDTTEKKISEGRDQKVYRKMSANLRFGYQMKDTKNPKLVATGVEEHQKALETDLNLKVSVGIEKELTTQLVETETVTVNEKDDGLKLNPVTAVHTKNNEAEDQNVYENTTVGSKKLGYSREEIEALRSVDEEGQKSKWVKVYSGFAPSVAREYTGLVVDATNRLTQRYNRVVNCGSTRHANASLNIPPVLPLCSSSYYM